MYSPNKIIINTITTYGQSLLALILSLFSTRWVLDSLGVVDLGLFGVVGSIIFLANFVNTAMSIGVARFYAFSVGRGNILTEEDAIEDLKKWFNTALSIHMLLPLILVIVGWPLGEYAVLNWLTIPGERLEACLTVFRISLLMAVVSVISVPFTSMYSAHQYISELSFFAILQTILTFVCAWLLSFVEGDRLIFYASSMASISAFISAVQIYRAVIKFKACRLKRSYLYDRKYLKNLFSFVGWKIFTASCTTFRDQGCIVITNLYFGPVVNAAYSVAGRVSYQANALSAAMTNAFQPALTSVEGNGDRSSMLSMAMQASKFGTFLILFFVTPIMVEMDNILEIWLINPPDYAGMLCRWMLAILVLDKMTSGAMLAVNAHGKVAVYDPVQGLLILLSVPLMYLFISLKYGAHSIGYALFISMLLYCVARLVFGKYLVKLSFGLWIKQIAIPIFIILFSNMLIGLIIVKNIEVGFLRICLNIVIISISTMIIGWFILLNKTEKDYLINIISNKFNLIKLK